ncbi:putative ubiquitin-conjugating enzyme E2 38 [Cocos nucifera]|uniref:E2 ubiquitin-conjugating enzyme n=1 Tax=Cocos nucifera TaxID=13894 RepID=A0A8K0I3B6_COCNU|nr:putative ubiquitin-conjugating enzyme E2 38 [Cocos nucifera]
MDANYSTNSGSKHHHFGGSASYQDHDVSSSSGWNSAQQKRKHCQAVPHEVIQIDGDDDPDSVMIIRQSGSDYKNKQTMEYDMDRQEEVKGVYSNDLIGSSSNSSNLGGQNDILMNTVACPELNLEDFPYMDEEEEDDDDEDYEYDAELIDNDCNYSLAAKFDDLDLPPGVEASVAWLQKSEPETSIDFKLRARTGDEIDGKFKSFKQFDAVEDYSDHYYANSSALNKPSKDWTKRIQHEWKVLEKDLPEMISVRVYEDRMDLLRAVMIGPAGTPYHDGLFFFDIQFPSNYPRSPPAVHYHSGGLRLNPNLYACGKVCLSLLNTWSGSGCEKWNPSNSTMLQVLVSIQALVLNSKPYFNEPGYSRTANTPQGERNSLAYNEEIFLLSCRTMLHSLRRPLKKLLRILAYFERRNPYVHNFISGSLQHFEDFVAGHFRKQGRVILVACRAYMGGAQVGSVIKDEVQHVDEDDKTPITRFKVTLKKLFEELLMEFTVKGAHCDEFLAQKVKAGPVAVAKDCDTTLRL